LASEHPSLLGHLPLFLFRHKKLIKSLIGAAAASWQKAVADGKLSE
jgi:hypothetical protein